MGAQQESCYLNKRPSALPVTRPAILRPILRPTRPFLTALMSPISRANKYSDDLTELLIVSLPLSLDP